MTQWGMNMTRHNVFISYHHANDQTYKEKFVQYFQNCFIDKSVHMGEYAEDLSTEYVKRLIREEKLTNSSVIVVLVGAETYKRKHVDWEISAGLSCMAGGYSGLIGILLPSYYTSIENYALLPNQYFPATLPPRLLDNVKTGFASLYTWNNLFMRDSHGYPILCSWLDMAFNKKYTHSHLINNSRLQYANNRA